MEKWRRFLEERFGGSAGSAGPMNILRWILIAAAVGFILMLLNSYLTVKDVGPIENAAKAGGTGTAPEDKPVFSAGGDRHGKFSDYEADYENEIKEIISKIVGVGEVDVLVTIDSTEQIVVERNYTDSQSTTNETDPQGAKRNISQSSRSGDVVLSNDAPIVERTIRPKIRGVVVVAEGAENMTVKKLIVEAVERGLDVPAHKISVVPSKR